MKVVIIKKKIKTPRNRTDYFKNYYEDNKEKILNSNKENDKNKYWMLYIRELRDGVIDWENVRQSTREKIN